MDIKGGKPVANRIKQRPLGAKTKTHFSGQDISLSVNSVKDRPPKEVPVAEPVQFQVAPAKVVKQPAAFPVPHYRVPDRPLRVVHKRLNKRMLILRGIATCIVIVVTVWGLLLWNGYTKFHKVFHGKDTVAALSTKSASPALLDGQISGRINILLLDTEGTGHSKPDVTDSIMVLSINTVNNSATLVSLPPDLWVQQPTPYFGKEQKLDVVYESGKDNYQVEPYGSNDPSGAVKAGLSNLDQVVESITGLNIDYHVLVNFQGFQQAVDDLGGVNVNVPTELRDPSLAYENHGSSIIAQPGVQNMDGAQASLYVRSHESTSNFSSLQRQLQVLAAVKDKVMTIGTLSDPAKINALADALDNNVYTDLTTQTAGQLGSIVQQISDNKVNSVNLFDSPQQIVTTGRIDGETVLLPLAGLDNYAAIQDYVRGQAPDVKLTTEAAPIAVLSKTADGAALTADFLKSYGYDVAATGQTSQQVSHLILVDLSGGKDPYTLQSLETHYGVKSIDELPAGISLPQGNAKFVIIEP